MNKEVEMDYSLALHTLAYVCQSKENLDGIVDKGDFFENVVSYICLNIANAVTAISDSNGKMNSQSINELFIILDGKNIIIELPEGSIDCIAGNAILFGETVELVQLDKSQGEMEISVIPEEMVPPNDTIIIGAMRLIIQSMSKEVNLEDIPEMVIEVIKHGHNVIEKASAEFNHCFLSDMLHDALNNIKVPKANEESFIEFIELTKLEFEKNKEIDYRDFTLSYQKSASYYNFIQKYKRTNILFTYDSELNYLFITDKNTDQKYKKEDYEGEDEYQKILVVEGLLKSIAGKIKAKEFFDQIS
ncbi:hypothetical protein [Pseudomonas aeruginosa]|uniref:hypothetical protein n=1 Tax=Pseudomonas aeruginosa TaxID=287 RepID=UPI002E2C6AF0|nr:hypothetical protein [Pseudomonas aeruginosa]